MKIRAKKPIHLRSSTLLYSTVFNDDECPDQTERMLKPILAFAIYMRP